MRDFSSAILQQGALTLALLYENDFEYNPYYRQQKLKEWAIGALRFWCKIQLPDGSLNEYYPYEHGYPPTSFSLYGAAQTSIIINYYDDNFVQALKKSCRYLSGISEKQAFNQEIAAVAAMISVYSITKDSWIKDAADTKLKNLLLKQSKEGWFPEYDGADIGYLSVSLDFLAEYYRLSNDTRVREPLKRMLSFLQYFVHPDGSVGGTYASRNTNYFLPGGLEIAYEFSDAARGICEELFGNPRKRNGFDMVLDDRYITHYVLHSYVRAFIQRTARKKSFSENISPLPNRIPHNKYFKEAGLATFNNGTYYAVIGLSKGGVIRLFNNEKEIFSDYGYRIKLSRNEYAVTNWLDHHYTATRENNQWKIEGHFHCVRQQTITPFKLVVLRILAYFMGRKLIPLLKKVLIYQDKKVPVAFKRTLLLQDNSIEIEDCILSSFVIKHISSAPLFCLRHVASSHYFQNEELLESVPVTAENISEIRFKRVFNVTNGKNTVERL